MRLITCFMIVCLFAIPVLGVQVGQVDVFQLGDPMNWDGAGPNVGVGSDASGELFLSAVSGGIDPLAVWNRTQWTGNYPAAGVTAIAVDLRSFVSTLSIRMFLFGGGSVISSPESVTIPNDGQWHHVVYSLSPGDLVMVHPKGPDLLGTLQGVQSLEFWHQPGPPILSMPSVAGSLGLDNITALPEPCALSLILLGVSLFRCR